MTKAALTMATLTLLASTIARGETVAEKKLRASVDEVAAKQAADIKDCGKTFKVTFDWKAFDSIDWKKIGREKNDYYDSERNSLSHLADGMNKLCADKDYKAAMSKISTIVFRSTNDESIRVKAVVSGATLTFDNYSFGSTRDLRDYESAAKAAL
ncbi:MAG TPA: hypothetical protein VGD80_33025 [Kofleriaceae bacterium]